MKLQPIAAAAFCVAIATSFPALSAEPAAKSAHPAGHEAMDHEGHCGLPAGEGVINTLNVKALKATIAHGPIAALGWSRMTMSFVAKKPVDLAAFSAGERVHFLLKADGGTTYAIAALCSLDADASAHQACMAHMHKTAMTLAEEGGKPCAKDHDAMDKMDDAAASGAAKDDAGHSGHQ